MRSLRPIRRRKCEAERLFGFHRAMDTAGAVVGPLTGIALYELLRHRFRPLFLVAMIPALVSTALIALVREGPRHRKTARLAESESRGLPRGYWRALILVTIFGLVNFSD